MPLTVDEHGHDHVHENDYNLERGFGRTLVLDASNKPPIESLLKRPRDRIRDRDRDRRRGGDLPRVKRTDC